MSGLVGRFPRRRPVNEYHPPKLDSRLNEARVMLQMRPHLRGIDAGGLRCQFNLRLETAARLLQEEEARRG